MAELRPDDRDETCAAVWCGRVGKGAFFTRRAYAVHETALRAGTAP